MVRPFQLLGLIVCGLFLGVWLVWRVPPQGSATTPNEQAASSTPSIATSTSLVAIPKAPVVVPKSPVITVTPPKQEVPVIPEPPQALEEGISQKRGAFIFPAPYNTRGYRITEASDCGGKDCVHAVGYSYWPIINNSAGSDTLYLFVTFDTSRGGEGPTLFSLHKPTDTIKKIGPLFNTGDPRRDASGENWYFSGTMPTVLYTQRQTTAPTLERYDILARTSSVVFDISTRADLFGTGRYVTQLHSSHDDSAHSFTVKDSSTYKSLGCGVYLEKTKQFKYFPTVKGDYDECQIDKSGRYLVIKEQVDGTEGEDNRIIDLVTDAETRLLDKEGAAGHSDLGFGHMIAADNWYKDPVLRLWKFGTNPLSPGTVVYQQPSWTVGSIDHVSWSNAKDTSPASQYACGSGVSSVVGPRTNEVVCFRTDGSGKFISVAPVMTDLAAVGGRSDYEKAPKGSLDATGEYFIWSSNTGSNRLDVFMVKVPYQKLLIL